MTSSSSLPDAALTALRAALGDDAVKPTPAPCLQEPRDLFTGHSPWLAEPRTTAQVVKALQVCSAHRIPVIPYGGGTGLVGGQTDTAVRASLLLSTARLNDIRRIDALDAVLVCGAGLTLHDVQQRAADHGMLFPLSLASEGSCTVGGNLATNAGGVNVLRYGNARALCLGVEAVLADGTVVSDLGGLRKDNTGYALSQLLIGSEGTLGVITAAALRLFPQPHERVATLAAVPHPRAALALLDRLQQALGERVTAFELISHQGIAFLAESGIAHRMPLTEESPWYVLTEVASGPDPALGDTVANLLADAASAELVDDAIIASNEAQRQALWHLRESIPEANRLVGSVASFDISVPISAIPDFIDHAQRALGALDSRLRINCFGHVGDGNLHFNSFPPTGASKADFRDVAGEVKRIVYDLVDTHGGSFSAEHGVGRQKTGQLAQYGDPGKLAAMRAIKQALDPHNLLNPGAVLPD